MSKKDDMLIATLSGVLSDLITDTKALSECLGCSLQAISQYKSGKSVPSLDKLIKIADFYNVSIDFLVGRQRKIDKTQRASEAIREYSEWLVGTIRRGEKSDTDYNRGRIAGLDTAEFIAMEAEKNA